MASSTDNCSPETSDTKKEKSSEVSTANNSDKKLEDVRASPQDDFMKRLPNEIEQTSVSCSQVSDIDYCSVKSSVVDAKSIGEDSPTSSRTDCTVVLRAASENTTETCSQNGSDNESRTSRARCKSESTSEFHRDQILCAKRLPQRDHREAPQSSSDSGTKTKKSEGGSRNEVEDTVTVNDQTNGLIEIDLSDSQYEQLVVDCCDQLVEENRTGESTRSNYKLPAHSLSDGVCAETMLSGPKSCERCISRRRSSLEKYNRCNQSCQPMTLDAIALARNECETGNALGFAGDTNGSGMRCIADERAIMRAADSSDFRSAPTKMVFASQRMKEYFESFKSRSGEKLRLYQFFKSTRTELVACLLLSLIVAQAQIVIRTQMQQQSDWPSVVVAPSSSHQRGNKQQIDPATGKGFAHFAGGLATAFTVASLTQVFGHVSGCHLLPSISLALYFKGHTSRARLASYLAAQSIGPFVGVALLSALTSSQVTPTEYWSLIARRIAIANDSLHQQLELAALANGNPAPIMSNTQSSSSSVGSLTQRPVQLRRRRRHAAISNADVNVNATISTKLQPGNSTTTTSTTADIGDDYLHRSEGGSETILLSIEEELRRQLELKRSQVGSSRAAPSSRGPTVEQAADVNRPHKPETGSSSAEGIAKTIRVATIGSNSAPTTPTTTATTPIEPSGTYAAVGDTGASGGVSGGWPEAKSVELEAGLLQQQRQRDGSISDESPSKSANAPPVQYDHYDATTVHPHWTSPRPEAFAANEPQAPSSFTPELVSPLPASTIGATSGDITRGQSNSVVRDSAVNVNKETQPISESSGIATNGFRLRRRKRNRLQSLTATYATTNAEKGTKADSEPQQQNWSINNPNSNGFEQPASPPILPASFSKAAASMTPSTRDFNNNKLNDRHDDNFPAFESNPIEDFAASAATMDNKDHNSINNHYINLLEFALPDKVMAAESIRQCINKQTLPQEQTSHRSSSNSRPETASLPSLQARDSLNDLNPNQLSSAHSTGGHKLNPTSQLATRTFYHCLVLSNGSQMFILQLVATLIVVLTYLVNVDPRRDDAGFKSFSIGLAYFVACILTTSSGGFYGNPFHVISVAWFSSTAQWESEWYIYLLTPLIGGLFGAMSHDYIDYTSSRNCNKRLHLRRSFYSLDTLPTGNGHVAAPNGIQAEVSGGGGDIESSPEQRRREQTHHQARHQSRDRRRGSNAATILETSCDDGASLGSSTSSRLANLSPGSLERLPAACSSSSSNVIAAVIVGGNNNDLPFADRNSVASTATQFATTSGELAKRTRQRQSRPADECKQEEGPAQTKLAVDSNNNELPNVSKTLSPTMQSRKLSPYARELKLERKRLLERQSQLQQVSSASRCNLDNKLNGRANSGRLIVQSHPTAANRSSCCNGRARRHSDYDTNFLISQPTSNEINSASIGNNKHASSAGASTGNCMTTMGSTMTRPTIMSATSAADQFSASFNASYM